MYIRNEQTIKKHKKINLDLVSCEEPVNHVNLFLIHMINVCINLFTSRHSKPCTNGCQFHGAYFGPNPHVKRTLQT